MPRPKKLAHVVLRTGRLDEMADWYIRLLDARTVFRDQRACFMSFDDEHHRLGILKVEVSGPSPPASAGLEHIAFTYASLADLVEVYAELKSDQVLPIYAINHGPTMSIYYEDLDGNHLELMSENFATDAEANAFVSSEAFRANPRGFRFDPEMLLARLRAGTPVGELTQFAPLA
jgi:catechol-2,3-dioxygenase